MTVHIAKYMLIHAAVTGDVGAPDPAAAVAAQKGNHRRDIFRTSRTIHNLHVLFGTFAQGFQKVRQNRCLDRTGTDAVHSDSAITPSPAVHHGPYDDGLFGEEIGAPALVPHYPLVDQGGLDAQLTLGGWLWKFELIGRDGAAQEFTAATGGFEYTFVGVAGSVIDVGLLTEYLWDDRGKGPAPFDNKNVRIVGADPMSVFPSATF